MKKPVQETIDVEAHEVQGVDPHKVESLTEIAREAEALEGPQGGEGGAGAPQGAPEPSAAAVDPETAPGVADLVNLMELAREAADPLLVDSGAFEPGQVAAIWSEPSLRSIAVPLVQICDRHGMGVGEVLDRWGPYVGLAAAVLFPSLATYKALRANKAAKAPDGQQREA